MRVYEDSEPVDIDPMKLGTRETYQNKACQSIKHQLKVEKTWSLSN